MSGASARRSHWPLWAIAAIAAAPLVASLVAYYLAPPEGHVNHGELIAPRLLPDAQLRLLDGTPFRFGQLKGKWALVTIDAADCGERCRQKLYYMRQVRTAQGREMQRVERVWLVSDESAPDSRTLAAIEGTWVARAPREVQAAFAAQAAPSDHIYVVDPLGNLMMRYPPDPDPRRMIKDLSRLLRASRIG